MKKQVSTVPLFELRKISTEFPSVKITCSHDAQAFCKQFYFDDIEIFESSFLLLLNQANITIGYAKISQGGISGTVVDARVIAHYAISSLAPGVILCHNHPSGNLRPSDSDKSLTAKVKQGLKLLDIELLDHLILTKEDYFSFADDGIL